MQIPFNKIFYTGKETEYLNDAMTKGQICGDGYYTHLVSSMIEEKFHAHKALMTTSASHAMDMAALMVGLKPGDEVIMPSFTFPSTANAVLLRGAKVVFADIEEDTLNIDIKDVQRKITSSTRAVIPVHYGGICCDMDKLMDTAQESNLYIIEDAAHGVNAKYKGKYLGTLGHIGCFSFHSTKNYTCGEGGALLINTSKMGLVEKGEIIRQKGTDRSRYIRGEIDRYSWIDVGSSYVPSDILMAFLYAQLKELDSIRAKRKEIHDFYHMHLMEYAYNGVIKMSNIPKDSESNYHIFYILFNQEKDRDKVIDGLKSRGICTATHYVPLHSSPMGQKLGYKKEELPISEKAGSCLIRLPMYTSMTREEMEYIISNLEDILKEI